MLKIFYPHGFFLFFCFSFIASSSASVNTCSILLDASERLKCFDQYAENNKIDSSIIFSRHVEELRHANNKFIIIPHRPNYILPITYSGKINGAPHEDILKTKNGEREFSKTETKFQFSFKFPVKKNFLNERTSLWLAYTQVSFWQVYRSSLSRPFRENNYEPELLIINKPENGIHFFGLKNVMNSFSINHQSNGRAGEQSRSWNRLIFDIAFEKNQSLLVFKPWYRLPEKDAGDENPDIHKYLGYGEVDLFLKVGEQVCGIRFYNNFRTDHNKSSFEVTWTTPLSERIKGVAHYFDGYGESLIDYNFRSRRVGLGIMLTDWM